MVFPPKLGAFGTLASVGFCFGGLRESRSEFVRVFSFPQTSGSQHEVEGCWKDEELEELGPIRGVRSPEVFGVERTPRDFGSSLNGCELPKPKHPQVHISNAVARQGMWKVLKTGSWIGVIMWVSLFVLICFYCYILLYKHTYKSIYIYIYIHIIYIHMFFVRSTEDFWCHSRVPGQQMQVDEEGMNCKWVIFR